MSRDWFSPLSKNLEKPKVVDVSRLAELQAEKDQMNKCVDEALLEKNKVDCSQSYEDILEISKKYGVRLEKSSFSYNMCREILNIKIQRKIAQLETKRSGIEDELQIIEWNQRMRFMCPQCKGKGKIINIEYFREDGQVDSRSNTLECPLCNGTGKIK
jgi:hypothetical protein